MPKRLAPASGHDNDKNALHINADERVLAATLLAGKTLEHSLNGSPLAYLVPASGLIEVNGVRASARDGLAINAEGQLRISALQDSELLVELG